MARQPDVAEYAWQSRAGNVSHGPAQGRIIGALPHHRRELQPGDSQDGR